jgi:hypothetical protein
MELIDRFPLDYSSFKDMKGRRRNGCEIAPEFRVFRSFLRHMKSARPSPDWTLDRINPFRKEYGPGLCRWAAKEMQANNRTDTIMLTGPDGRTLPLTEWAKISGQNADTMRARIRRGGWTPAGLIAGRREQHGRTIDHVVEVQLIEAVPVPLVNNWPEGMQAAAWEEHYQKFCRTWPEYARAGVSRAAFMGWVLTNASRQARDELRRHFPAYQEGYDEEPVGYIEHPKFSLMERCEKRVGEALRLMDGDNRQVGIMHQLIRQWPHVQVPQSAAGITRPEEVD